MQLVLDTNEFIGAVGVIRNPASERLFTLLVRSFSKHTIRIPRTIINEIKRNLPPIIFTEFIKTIQSITSIDEDIIVPFELAGRYELLGFKPADSFISAYTEFVGADALVTENRHFLSRQSFLPFKVLDAKGCLKLLGK